MKKVIFGGIILFTVILGIAGIGNPYGKQGSWNPYVKKGGPDPGALLPWQLNGNGTISFIVGNKGNDPVTLVKNQEMKLVITLSNGMPDVTPLDAASAVTVIGGSGSSWFTWTYNKVTNSYTGVQNRVIPALSEGSVTIKYKVTVNSDNSMPANGFNVNITPPAYTNGINRTDDDAFSSYSLTKASDYGDAPASYGVAEHTMDVGSSSTSVVLGTLIDYEAVGPGSQNADNDDDNGMDDEDGVVFPLLILENTVDIPVIVTALKESPGFLGAWIDWNGNGVFDDQGEQIAKDVLIAGIGMDTIDLKGIKIPAHAVTASPIYARFRVGPENMKSTGTHSFGEVEDYKVQIVNPFIGIDEKDLAQRIIIYSFKDNIYVKDLTGKDLRGTMSVYNLIGQRITERKLKGGSLNMFNMNVEKGYYFVEVEDDNGMFRGKVYLTR